MNTKYLMGLFIVSSLVLAGCASGTDNWNEQTPPKTTGQVVETGVTKDVYIDGTNWNFAVTGDSINKGDRVRMHVKGSEGVHGIAIPGLGVNSNPIPVGEVRTIEFVASDSGSFEYFCNVPCGSGHMKMRGQLIVN